MIRFAVAAAAFLAVFFCLPAIAAQCAPASIMLPALERTGEKVIWQGIAGGHLVLLFQHPENQQWTFVGISPKKMVCVVAHGNAAELVTERKVRVEQERRNFDEFR